jgi:hypothetical protein
MSVRAHEAFAVIGDIVRSRGHADQMGLFGVLEAELRWVNDRLERESVLQPLEMTIGDEFQGAFKDLSTALRAVLLSQLRLAGRVPLRFGVGHGEVQFAEAADIPRGQSGTAGWAARSSVEAVEAAEATRHEHRSCAFASTDRRLEGSVEAFLILRDRILDDMDERDLAIALGLALGQTQVRIAERLGIDPAAVTRRKYTNRVATLLAAHAALDGSPRDAPSSRTTR